LWVTAYRNDFKGEEFKPEPEPGDPSLSRIYKAGEIYLIGSLYSTVVIAGPKSLLVSSRVGTIREEEIELWTEGTLEVPYSYQPAFVIWPIPDHPQGASLVVTPTEFVGQPPVPCELQVLIGWIDDSVTRVRSWMAKFDELLGKMRQATEKPDDIFQLDARYANLRRNIRGIIEWLQDWSKHLEERFGTVTRQAQRANLAFQLFRLDVIPAPLGRNFGLEYLDRPIADRDPCEILGLESSGAQKVEKKASRQKSGQRVQTSAKVAETDAGRVLAEKFNAKQALAELGKLVGDKPAKILKEQCDIASIAALAAAKVEDLIAPVGPFSKDEALAMIKSAQDYLNEKEAKPAEVEEATTQTTQQ
jgi:hypothetical protein